MNARRIWQRLSERLFPSPKQYLRPKKPPSWVRLVIEQMEDRIAPASNFTATILAPPSLTYNGSAAITVEYQNTGATLMSAPVLQLTASQNGNLGAFLTLDPTLQNKSFNVNTTPAGFGQSVQILASGSTPGFLEPGESATVTVYYGGWLSSDWSTAKPAVAFSVGVLSAANTTTIDWSSMEADMRPSSIPSAAWPAIFANLTTQMGSTWGSYVQNLDAAAAYLGPLGETYTNVNALWALEIQRANGLGPMPQLAATTDLSVPVPGVPLAIGRVFPATVIGRNLLGPFGYGWELGGGWGQSLAVELDNSVIITQPNGTQLQFTPTAGGFSSPPGDYDQLANVGNGVFSLTQPDGQVTEFANGQVAFIQDTNGNRVTTGYTSGRLGSLTASSGQSITISYSSAGLISAVADSLGQVTTYSYDATNNYLTSVTGFNGQTITYTYNTTIGSQAQNALTTIAFPGGTHQYFTFDSEGRLAGTSNEGGAQPQTFAYSQGQVSITDGTGDTSNLFYNEQGLLLESIDPLGNVTLDIHDSNFNLVKVTNALGQSETNIYNTVGEVTTSTDFLGNTTKFVYAGQFNQLASMTDANGNKATYARNSAGDLLSTTYANGTSASSTFNPGGEATSFLNANGQPINYTYNAAGQILTETFSDGTQYAYTYNGFGAMVTATDATGTTTFNYDPTTELMTKVAYPNGMFLTFAYNAAGHRTSMVDQTGFTVNYGYDSVGRLSGLTDGSGNQIVTYTYDANGRLRLKTNNNGTYTTYQYDADGNVLSLINYAAGGGTINSSFAYTYNALGLETSEVTLDGAWTYTYDADGQLTHAVFASTNPSVPSQDLAYNYDAMSNRLTTVINGVTTAYTTNNVNEYTSVGGVAETYDADGNLTYDGTNTYTYNSLNQQISVSGPSGTTTYSYNALGQQVAATTNGVTTQYLIDASGLGSVVGQYAGGGELIADYTYGLGLTSQVTAGGRYYYDFDSLGSTVGLSTSSGAYADTYSYLPFGQSQTSTQAGANPFQFVGEWGVMEDGNGTTNMRSRNYDVILARFEQIDPLSHIELTSQTYSYANNDPISAIDPSGWSSWRLAEFKSGIDSMQSGVDISLIPGSVEGPQAIVTVPYILWDIGVGFADITDSALGNKPLPPLTIEQLTQEADNQTFFNSGKQYLIDQTVDAIGADNILSAVNTFNQRVDQANGLINTLIGGDASAPQNTVAQQQGVNLPNTTGTTSISSYNTANGTDTSPLQRTDIFTNGDSQTLGIGTDGNVANTLTISPQSNGHDSVTMSGQGAQTDENNASITMTAGASGTVDGNGNTITGQNACNISVSGDNTLNIANSCTITINPNAQNMTTETVVMSGGETTVVNNATNDVTISASGTGGIEAQGGSGFRINTADNSDVAITASGCTITAGNNSLCAVNGVNDTLTIANGVSTTTDGQTTNAFAFSNELYDPTQIANIFGSQLGEVIAGNNPFAKAGGAAIGSVVVGNLLQLAGIDAPWLDNNIAASLGSQGSFNSAVNAALGPQGTNLIGSLEGKALSTLSSLLLADAAQKLGISGFAGQVFTTTGSTIASQLLSNIAAAAQQGQTISQITSDTLLVGMKWATILSSVGSALGSYLGSKIGNGLINPANVSQELFDLVGGTYLGAAGGEIGSAVADALANEVCVDGAIASTVADALEGTVLGDALGTALGGVTATWSWSVAGERNWGRNWIRRVQLLE
jgi:RHS repeat-associated protein